MMEDNSKYKLIATLCLLATIITAFCSMVYTSMLFSSMGKGAFAIIPILMGVCSDFGKYGFTAAATYSFNRGKFVSSIVFGVIAIGCLVVSFGASQAYDLNQKNKIKNEALTKNGSYKRNEKIFDVTAKTIEENQKELSNLTTNKEKLIAESVKSLETQRDSLPNDYITKRAQVQEQINEIKQNKTNEINSRIAQLEKNIKNSNNNVKEVNNDFNTLESKVETTEGIHALAKWINPKNPEEVIGSISLLKNIFLEVISIAFSMAFGLFLGKSRMIKTAKDTIAVTVKPEQEDKEYLAWKQSNNMKALANDTPDMLPSNGKENTSIENNTTKKKRTYSLKKNKIPSHQIQSRTPLEIRSTGVLDKKNKPKIGFKMYMDEKQPASEILEMVTKPVIESVDGLIKKTNIEQPVARKIGFQYNKRETLPKWQVKFLYLLYNKNYHTKQFGATGCNKISKLIPYDHKECIKFRGLLEQIGVLKTVAPTGKNNFHRNELVIKNVMGAVRKVEKAIIENRGGI